MDLITAKKIRKEYSQYRWQTNSNEIFTEKMTMFTLTGKGVTYAFAALESGHLAHVYYGKRADDEDLSYLMRLDENPYTPKVNQRDMGTFMDNERNSNGQISFETDSMAVGNLPFLKR